MRTSTRPSRVGVRGCGTESLHVISSKPSGTPANAQAATSNGSPPKPWAARHRYRADVTMDRTIEKIMCADPVCIDLCRVGVSRRRWHTSVPCSPTLGPPTVVHPVLNSHADLIKAHLQDELVNADGNAVDPDDVATVVDAAATSFEDAPVQEFTPLLIEHDARNALRDKGFRRELDDEEDAEVWIVGEEAVEPKPEVHANFDNEITDRSRTGADA
jgi:hypothetical protein